MKISALKCLFLVSFLCLLTKAFSQDTIRILVVGNSFSEDAAEAYFDDLAKAGGVKLVVGNLYIGGCSLQRHWNNAVGDIPDYSYRKIIDGDTVKMDHHTLKKALIDETWDYVTFQQVSQESGRVGTYFPFLTDLMAYVKGMATNPEVRFCLHRTWAYAANSTHPGFANYDRNQHQMFDSIVSATNQVAVKAGIDLMIPSGTAIQNARSSSLGDNLNRDGYHLSYGLGRYTAACVWFEKLLGKPVVGNPFVPAGVSKVDAELAQQAAHLAVLKPDVVTPMSDSKTRN